MIAKMRLPAALASFQGVNRNYQADADGFVFNVETCDVDTLRAAGAEPIVLPATIDLKVEPHQNLHFGSVAHKADEHGLILRVPYDTAMVLIRDESNPAREATAAEVALIGAVEPALVNGRHTLMIGEDELATLRAVAAQSEAIFTTLGALFGDAGIVDTGTTIDEHGDMVFAVVKDGVETLRGTVTELFAAALPKPETLPAPTPALAPTPEIPTAPVTDTEQPPSPTEKGDASDKIPTAAE